MLTALITGITGQDGSYLTEYLLEKGYVVHGLVRRSSMFNRGRIEHLRVDPTVYGKRLFLHYADLRDVTATRRIVSQVKPNELYHLAGQSHVGLSFEMPESTCQEVALCTLSIFEIVRDATWSMRVYYASSSEVFGVPDTAPQTEITAFRPISPYGCAKAFATNLGLVYRKAHNIFISNGIAYNHESIRRGENFVTRKITAGAARIKANLQEELILGNLNASRDWGYAPEYVEAMWLILQQKQPDDYILATGRKTTVRDFTVAAFRALGVELVFEGIGVDEIGRDRNSGRVVVRVDRRFWRTVESGDLVGDGTKIETIVGWKPITMALRVAERMAVADWDSIN
jgi:GDPmannose 4,6-dehydratase